MKAPAKITLREYKIGGPQVFFLEKPGSFSNPDLVTATANMFSGKRFFMAQHSSTECGMWGDSRIIIFTERIDVNSLKLSEEASFFKVMARAVMIAQKCHFCPYVSTDIYGVELRVRRYPCIRIDLAR